MTFSALGNFQNLQSFAFIASKVVVEKRFVNILVASNHIALTTLF